MKESTDKKPKRLRKKVLVITLYVDDRERDFQLIEFIKKQFESYNKPGRPRIKIIIKQLRMTEGDYLFVFTTEDGIEHKILIERKTLIDFFESVYDHRLDKQLEDMIIGLNTKKYDACSLCIIGNPLTEVNNKTIYKELLFNTPAKWSTLIKKMAKFDSKHVPSHLAFDNELAAIHMSSFVLYHDSIDPTKHKVIQNIPKIIKNIPTELETTVKMFMGIPNVGQEIAIGLAKLCNGDISFFHTFSVEDIMRVTAPKALESGQPSKIKKSKTMAEYIWNKFRGKHPQEETEDESVWKYDDILG
jgi:ERCC4-type nuclease